MEKHHSRLRDQLPRTYLKRYLAFFFIALLVFATVLHPLFLSTQPLSVVSYARLRKYSVYFIVIIFGGLYAWQRLVIDTVYSQRNSCDCLPVSTVNAKKIGDNGYPNNPKPLPKVGKSLVALFLCFIIFGYVRMRTREGNTFISQFDNFSFMILGSGAFLVFALLLMDCILLIVFGCSVSLQHVVRNYQHWTNPDYTDCLVSRVRNVIDEPMKHSFYWDWRKFSDEIISPICRAVLVILVTIGVTLHGLYIAHRTLEVTSLDIPVERLPLTLQNFTIVQVSDFHIGPWLWTRHVSMVVDSINSLEPDVIVIVGDLVDLTLDLVSEALEPLKWLKSKKGIFFVSGNHDYYLEDVNNLNSYLKSIGITVLNNENVRICAVEPSTDDCFNLIGTEDISQGETAEKKYGHSFQLARAMDGVDTMAPSVLLTHQPLAAKMAAMTGYKYDLILSGHTHGGQFFPFSLVVYLSNPYYHGLYHVRENTYLYVSNGVGFWGIPMRLFAPPEIAVHSLVRKQPIREDAVMTKVA